MKKSFSLGLEGLFSGDSESKPKSKKKNSPKQSPSVAKKKTKKEEAEDQDFMSNLDKLFQESVESKGLDSLIIDTSMRKSSSKKKSLGIKAKGFDALFTPTVDIAEQTETQLNKKRVTFTFEEDKLQVLKQIARDERSFLKDIINRIVTEYLQKQGY